MTHPSGGNGAGPDLSKVGTGSAIVRHRLRGPSRWRFLLALGTALAAPVLVSAAVDALEALAVDSSGVLTSPKEFEQAGWYADGTVPGDAGPAVIAGHVDSRTGPAVFFRLHELTPGAEVDVARDGQWLVFTVTAVERYPKARFPSEKVYGPTPGAELRLITCGGTFDPRQGAYRDNVVVYAVLATDGVPRTG